MNNIPKKMNGESLDIPADNRKKLKQLFPTVFTETVNDKGELVESVDFEKLKAELGTFTDLFENRRERYGMDWPGKKDAIRLIQTPSAATLKPCRKESVNFDTTENLFIEGDNLEVLKLLQKSYYGKVKMICIDPPYNTGKEFIYPDNYSESLETYLEYAGLIDGDGKRFSTNTANEGRFHTKWLNMMYPRLYLARNLLRDDGVIFIHIDDNEVSNLRKICDEIYGDDNFRNIFAIRRYDKNLNRQFIESGLQTFNVGFEYVLCYSKTSEFSFNPIIKESGEERQSIGYWKGFWNDANRPTMQFDILGFTPESGQWKWSKERSLQAVENYKIFINKFSGKMTLEEYYEKTGKILEFIRRNPEGKGKNKGVENWIPPSKGKLRNTNWTDLFASKNNSEVEGLFDFPKNPEVIENLIVGSTDENDIVLDFFAGSATTAHAVLDLNKQDGGNRKFILVQLPEPCATDSEAFKAGYKTIADIGKERIRRVIKKLNDEQKGKLALKSISAQDRGFKVLKLNKSNFKQWQKLTPDAAPEQIAKQLSFHIDHIDHKATPEDLLYEILLKTGFTPTEKVQPITLAEIPVFSIADGGLLICLVKAVTKELINAVAEAEPMQFICLDSAFKGNDQLKANTVQTFNARNIGKEKHNQIVFKTV